MKTPHSFLDCRLVQFLRRLGGVIAASATVLTGMATPINLDTQNVPDDVKQAVKRLPSAQVSALGKDRVPTIIQGYLGRIEGAPDSAKVHAALPDVLAAFRLKSGELKLAKTETDKLGMSHYRFEQSINGLPVVGASFSVHVDNKSGRISSANGNARSVEITRVPKIAAMTAEKKALDVTKDAKVTGTTELMYVISSGDGSLHLAYRVELVGINGVLLHDFVFIDALDGSFVARHPQIFDSRNRETYESIMEYVDDPYYPDYTWTLPGDLRRSEGEGATGDQTLDITHDNAGITYDYYAAVFGRDSIDGAGMTIKSSVHYSSPNDSGESNYNNAYWDGWQLVFGDGDGYTSTSWGLALDLVAHEFTHGVTQYSSGLIYYGESGGLNEAMSDIFGSMCEAWRYGESPATWMMFEDIWTPNQPGDALRYMDDPAADGGSLDYYPDYHPGIGVHDSSGIANLAFKLLVTGGTHPRGKTSVNVPGIGTGQAQQIFYRANTYYAGPSTGFLDFRQHTALAAADLYGSSAQYSTNAAWAAVGVGSLPSSVIPNASVSPSSSAFGQYVTLTQDGSASAGIAWTENVIWQPNGQADVLGNKGLGSISYMPHAGPGTYWYQFRLVDTAYNYEDQWISFTVEAPTGWYLIPAMWVSPAIPISYGNSVTLYPFGMASDGVAWTENVIWQPDDQLVMLGNLGVGGAWSYTPAAGPGLYWYQFRLVDNNINYVDQWSYFYVVP